MWKVQWTQASSYRLPTFDPNWKDKCMTCAHMEGRRSKGARPASITITCRASSIRNGAGQAACISERTEGICGSQAKLWEPMQ